MFKLFKKAKRKIERKIATKAIESVIRESLEEPYMKKIVDWLHALLAKLPLNGKKAQIGLEATTWLTAIDVLDKIVTDPNFHQFLHSIAGFFPAWAIYISLGITAFGKFHQFVKFLQSILATK